MSSQDYHKHHKFLEETLIVILSSSFGTNVAPCPKSSFNSFVLLSHFLLLGIFFTIFESISSKLIFHQSKLSFKYQ